MPYKAARDDRCPASKPWGVVKETDGALMGCHPTEDAAVAQLQAIMANEPDTDALPAVGIEVRSIDEGIELRAGDDGISFTGYAAVWNSPSRPLPFTELVAPGAFARSIRTDRDIKLLVDHNPERLLASTTTGSLRLTEDERGLRAEADLAPTSYAHDLRVLADRGEVRSMSFAFKPTRGGEAWSEDGQTRTLTDVRLFEVSILTGNAPAYERTSAFIRSLAHQLEAREDALASAIMGLADGRELDDDEVRLLEAAIASLRPAPTVVPPELHRRRLALVEKAPD